MSANIPTLEDLVTNLAVATADLEQKEKTESFARDETITAKNRVNDLQKAIDNRIAELKKAAPRDTEWRRGEIARGPRG